jgi:hypothetical protein
MSTAALTTLRAANIGATTTARSLLGPDVANVWERLPSEGSAPHIGVIGHLVSRRDGTMSARVPAQPGDEAAPDSRIFGDEADACAWLSARYHRKGNR